MKKRNFVWIAAAMLAAGCGNSQQGTSGGGDTSSTVTDSTAGKGGAISAASTEFAAKAATSVLFETELGKLARNQGLNKLVKDFGSLMINDHSKSTEELQAIAGRKGITLPSALTDEQTKDLEDLKGKKGVEFDKSYVKKMLQVHRSDIAEFKNAAKEDIDADLKDFASKSLPVIKAHYDSLRSINKVIKATVDPGEITDGVETLPLR